MKKKLLIQKNKSVNKRIDEIHKQIDKPQDQIYLV